MNIIRTKGIILWDINGIKLIHPQRHVASPLKQILQSEPVLLQKHHYIFVDWPSRLSVSSWNGGGVFSVQVPPYHVSVLNVAPLLCSG